jgi:hypothetical protein
MRSWQMHSLIAIFRRQMAELAAYSAILVYEP